MGVLLKTNGALHGSSEKVMMLSMAVLLKTTDAMQGHANQCFGDLQDGPLMQPSVLMSSSRFGIHVELSALRGGGTNTKAPPNEATLCPSG